MRHGSSWIQWPLLFAALMVSGCYSPVIGACTVLCGYMGECPDGLTCGGDWFCHATSAPAQCPNTGVIHGSVAGQGFNANDSSYWFNDPADATDLLVFLLSSKVSCAALADAGWGSSLSPGTQVLELQFRSIAPGVSPGGYGVSPPSPPVDVGTAAMRSLAPGAAPLVADGGTAELSMTTNGNILEVDFRAGFGAQGSLSGASAATACPNGHEW